MRGFLLCVFLLLVLGDHRTGHAAQGAEGTTGDSTDARQNQGGLQTAVTSTVLEGQGRTADSTGDRAASGTITGTAELAGGLVGSHGTACGTADGTGSADA